jgi:DNA polymerase-3 subunit epsilon/CBS domain-containing protein
VPQLAAEWGKLPRAAAGLLTEGVGGRDIAAVISGELGALTRRAAVLAEQRMAAEGRGGPPCAYAFCVLGSAGRGESLLAMDQDNALVFADGEPGGDADRWFGELGTIVADILHEVGVPYCNGGVMAKNEQWRGSLDTWRTRIAEWIGRSDPSDLLSVDIFFDLTGVHGDVPMAGRLWREAYDAARGNATFAKLLVEAAGQIESGLTFFGGFRTENGRLDLKRTGLFGIVSVARALAIHHHIVQHSTRARLAGLAALDRGKTDLDALAQAQTVFLDLILAQQLADIHAGRPPTNKVETKRQSREDRARLKQALESTANLDALSRDLLF